jgi:hypothetical protein
MYSPVYTGQQDLLAVKEWTPVPASLSGSDTIVHCTWDFSCLWVKQKKWDEMGIFPTVPSLAEFSDCHIAFLVLLIPCQMGTNLSSVHFCFCFYIIKSSGWVMLCFKPVGNRKIIRKRARDQSALISALIFKQISNCLSVVVVLRRLHIESEKLG